MSAKRIGRYRATHWYCLVVALFLGIRALTTLAAGAHFTLPGDGWRSIWQLVLTVVLIIGFTVPGATRVAVATTGVVYLAATAWELFHPDDLLGAVPVDMRDHIVHPLLAVLAAVVLVIDTARAARGRRLAGTAG
ncbi:DUF4383 domain-containing protein [Nocardia sp. BMG111209]|uniref:DUF4383 domain-containing protein n=1 Tax=Nocardia sp. BMG111209 TaxID=1160137 RepID=UPI0003636CA0|nr:DUF4383 domain-containing protein [Nocardia sp. BMG111209]